MFASEIPRTPVSRRSLAVSVVAHALAILLLLSVRFAPTPPAPRLTPPATELVVPVRIATPRADPKRLPAVPAVEPPPPAPRTFRPPEPVRAPEPLLARRPEPNIVAPQIEAPRIQTSTPELTLPTAAPPPIKTGLLTEARAAAATAPAAYTESLKAAGFASSEASPEGPRRGTLAATGAFSTAESAGPATAAGSTRTGGFGAASSGTAHTTATRAVAEGGFGTASTGAASTGSDKRTIASTGFGAASAAQPGATRGGNIARGAFADIETAAPEAPRQKTAEPVRDTIPVEILSKPRPVYTEEARQLRIEGEVLLQVLFSAAGGVQVVQVISGLGHGLNEAATAAARQIRFRPARRAGQSVDQTATVHIVFQLAY